MRNVPPSLPLAPPLVVAVCLLAACGPPPDAGTRDGGARDGRDRDLDLVYVRSDRMPLSDAGVAEIAGAARGLGLPLRVLDADSLTRRPEGRRGSVAGARGPAARALVAAGATAHFPALVVRRAGRPVGPAILGYKTAAAYRALVARRLGGEVDRGDRGVSVPFRLAEPEDAAVPHGAAAHGGQAWIDVEVPGDPGAYFRWIPGTRRIAFEADDTIHLLDLETGERARAPGWVDLAPSPDGRILAAPSRGRRGLALYETEAVLRAAGRGRGAEVRPLYTDRRMRDQYPSVGLLDVRETPRGTVAVYRVLTAWFDRGVFRDYRAAAPAGGGALDVRPAGPRTPACRDRPISLPILSATGRELAARDESTGTTKLFTLADDGRCAETLDLGIPTGKVAFHGDGRRVAFAVPRGAVRDATGGGILRMLRMRDGAGPALEGVFVLDRDAGTLSRVPGSGEARRLAFPEFVGEEGVAFLLAGEDGHGPSRFRFVRSGRE